MSRSSRRAILKARAQALGFTLQPATLETIAAHATLNRVAPEWELKPQAKIGSTIPASSLADMEVVLDTLEILTQLGACHD